MATLRAEVHGPIRIVSTGENAWGGRLTISSGDAATFNIASLNTKVFRTTSSVILFPNNSTAGIMADRTTNTTTQLYATIPTHGTLRIVHSIPAADAVFAFLVFDGGTNLT